MWIFKGVLVGCAVFVLGTFWFLVVNLFRPAAASRAAIGLSALYGMKVGNPLFYVALLGCLLLGVALVGSWPLPVR